jgi:adenylosuccinate lyase
VQSHAMRSWETDSNFRAAIENDPDVRAHLSLEQIERAFAMDRQLANVDKIFARVFAS